MKLLILTQKVDINDDVLGFFHSWITEFSKHFEKVTVICLYKGDYSLPENVSVYSLGKEKERSRIKYLWNFYGYIFREKNNYDAVFVHMNQIYVVLGGFLWRMWHKKISLWYVHRQKSLSLWIAEKLSDTVFTSVPESFLIRSKKIKILGHGVETFDIEKKEMGNTITVLSMGRLTRIKNLDTAILAAEHLGQLWPEKKIKLVFTGSTIMEYDKPYEKEIRLLAQSTKHAEVVFESTFKFNQLEEFFRQADVTWNLTPTGGLDKSVLSAFSARRPTIVSNTAFKEILSPYTSQLTAKYRDPEDFAQKTKELLLSNDLKKLLEDLHLKVNRDYSVPAVIKKISEKLEI